MVNYQNWLCTSRKNEIEFKDLSKGDYIKCNVDNYKSLIKVIYTGRVAVATSQDIKGLRCSTPIIITM
jgi:hypothetical protein